MNKIKLFYKFLAFIIITAAITMAIICSIKKCLEFLFMFTFITLVTVVKG